MIRPAFPLKELLDLFGGQDGRLTYGRIAQGRLGLLAIAVGDQVNMLENSVYSVISPEGCASILWKDAERKTDAAEALKITAPDITTAKWSRISSRAGGSLADGGCRRTGPGVS